VTSQGSKEEGRGILANSVSVRTNQVLPSCPPFACSNGNESKKGEGSNTGLRIHDAGSASARLSGWSAVPVSV
jgi:hypothetical protein